MDTASIQARLDAYLAAESEILAAQQMSSNGKDHRMAELKDVQAGIAEVRRDLSRSAGKGPFSFSLANTNKARM